MDCQGSQPTNEHAIDLHAMAFPTDAITLGQMRRNEPYLLDELSTAPGHVATNDAFSTHRYEVMLALKAFASAAGHRDPIQGTSRAEIIEHLSDAYAAFGLVKGECSTKQLIEQVEAQAAQQARQRVSR